MRFIPAAALLSFIVSCDARCCAFGVGAVVVLVIGTMLLMRQLDLLINMRVGRSQGSIRYSVGEKPIDHISINLGLGAGKY